MSTITSLPRWWFAAAGLALLAACGGSDGPVTTALDGVPSSAQQTPEALAAYLGDLVQQQPEDREPFAIADGFTLPTSETAEPVALP